MQIEFNNGRLFIDDKEVMTVMFKDGSCKHFPVEDNTTSNTVISNAKGSIVSVSKNYISPGSTIVCGGDF